MKPPFSRSNTAALLLYRAAALILSLVVPVACGAPLHGGQEHPSQDSPTTIPSCVFDVLIALAYFAIPLQLVYFLRRCPQVPAKHVLVLFILFIFLCGTSHLVASWMMWWPTPNLLMLIKCLTAIVSLITTFALYSIIPRALALPVYARSMEMEVNTRLESERNLLRKNAQLDKLRQVTTGLRHTLTADEAIDSISRDMVVHLGAQRCFVYSRRASGAEYALVQDRRQSGSPDSIIIDDEDRSDLAHLLPRNSHDQHSDSGSTTSADTPASSTLPGRAVDDLMPGDAGPIRCQPREKLLTGIVGRRLADRHHAIIDQFTDGHVVYLIVVLYAAESTELDDVHYLMTDLTEQVTIALCQAELMENERRRTNQLAEINTALVQARREVENFHAQREFLAVMSHEMRTPLFATSALSSILIDSPVLKRDGAEFVEMADMLRVIQMSNEMLIGIVNNILDFTKYESEKFHLDEEPFSLRDAIETAIEIVCVQDELSKFPAVNYFIHNAVPEMVVGDFTRFRQIAVNLINNACKFTECSGSVNITLSTEASDNPDADDDHVKIKLTVKDTGIGIAEEALSRLYEKFYQADRSITRQYGGTGLGLAIVKRLTELMDGHIHVESTFNGGTTFTVDMSFKKALVSSKITPIYRFPVQGLSDISVAYVDHNQANRDGFVHLMSTLGVKNVHLADNIYDLARSCQQSNDQSQPAAIFNAVVIDLTTVQKHGCFPLLCSLLESVSTRNLMMTGNVSHHRQWRSLCLPEGVAINCMIRPIKARPMEKFLLCARRVNIAAVIQSYDLPALTPVSPKADEGANPIDKAFLQAMCTSVHRNSVSLDEIKTQTTAFVDDVNAVDRDESILATGPLDERNRSVSALATADSSSDSSSSRVQSTAYSPNIMVAEDNPINQMVIRRMLEQLGHSCTLVNNGQEAIDLFDRDRTFDIIFMDIMMPIKDGFQASTEIRQLFAAGRSDEDSRSAHSAVSAKTSLNSNSTATGESLAQERATLDGLSAGQAASRPWIIALTANAFWDDRVRCLDSGMNDFVAKPAKLADIRNAISRFMDSIPVVRSPRLISRTLSLPRRRTLPETSAEALAGP